MADELPAVEGLTTPVSGKVSFLAPKGTVVLVDATLTTEQIRNKIAQLSMTEEGENLRGAMDDLKKALKANPAACAAMLPQDIGDMVKHLMRLTGKDIEDAMASKKRTSKPKIDVANLSDEQKQALEDDLF